MANLVVDFPFIRLSRNFAWSRENLTMSY